MNTIKTIALVGGVAVSSVVSAATPVVTSVGMAQPGPTRLVSIDYTFEGADAVITLDVQTNANTSAAADDPGWTSIGGAAVCNAKGDVWKKVSCDGTTHHISWRPDLSWPDHVIADGGARAVVTAWTLDNTPDYMVVDISAAAAQNTQKYYPSAEFLPGGLLGKPDYRTTSIVMRKIMAKDVEWTMGSTALEEERGAAEDTHKVSLTNNYYIGVFPVTQAQWAQVKTTNPYPSHFTNAAFRAMRPVEKVSYNEIRNASSNYEMSSYDWPAAPHASSFLGLLRTRTGLDFDLPSEAQWEFAARAGNGDTKWGDGSGIMNVSPDDNLDNLGRYSDNGGKIDNQEPDRTCGAENGTSVVGSYNPNDWGLYDMFGDVWEWCLDWYANDISGLNGMVNTTTPSDKRRVLRGGAWTQPAKNCRPASRSSGGHNGQYYNDGFRVVCTANLQ